MNRTLCGLALLYVLGYAGALQALGFGGVQLDSALDQPLDARVTLVSLSQAERQSLSVHIASPRMFERFGVEHGALAEALRAEVVATRDDGRAIVRITSRRPVREPYLRFLLAADTSGGRALRTYTLLLDPPGQRRVTPPASAVPSAPARNDTPTARRPAPETPRTARRTGATDHNTYGPVQPGDSLWEIASRLRRADTTLDQMQVAIYRANPAAFNGAMNRLRRGARLRIPEAEAIRAIEQASAHEQVQATARSRRSGQQASTGAAQPAPPDARSSTGATLQLQAPQSELARSEGTGLTTTGSDFGRLSQPRAPTQRAPQDRLAGSDEDRSGQAGDDGLRTSGAQGLQGAAMQRLAVDQPPAGRLTGAGDMAGQPATDDLPGANAPPGAGRSAAPAPTGPPASGARASAGDGFRPVAPGGAPDVAGTPTGVLSPRNLVLLLIALLIGGWLLFWYRRRQYRDIPLDLEAASEPEYAGDTLVTSSTPPPFGQADEIETQPQIAPATPPEPAQVVADADRQAEVGLLDQAGATVDAGLAQHPDSTQLQDKRLELDYRNNDPTRFAQAVDRVRPDMAANSVRWAGIAAMGRILAPQDPRYVFGSATAAAHDRSAGPASQRAQPGAHTDTSSPMPTASADAGEATSTPGDDPTQADEISAQGSPPERVSPPEAPAPAAPSGEDETAPRVVEDYQPDPAAPAEPRPGAPHDTPADAQAPGQAAPEPDVESLSDRKAEFGLSADDNEPLATHTPPESAPEAAPEPAAGAAGQPAASGIQLDTFDPDESPSRDEPADYDPDVGMDFELDPADFEPRAARPGAVAAPGGDSQSRQIQLSPIDTSEFGMGEAESADQPAADDTDSSVQIRMDLAEMYNELQDYTAARELLAEVLAEGDAGQRESAQALLDRIDSESSRS